MIIGLGAVALIYWVVGLAGIVGSLLRYWIAILLPTSELSGFPLSTLIVNYIGCFFLSWFTIWSSERSMPSWIRLGIATGFIGSFTTFSTFSVEIVNMIHAGLWKLALVYVLLSLWGGLFLAWGGYRIAIGEEKGR